MEHIASCLLTNRRPRIFLYGDVNFSVILYSTHMVINSSYDDIIVSWKPLQKNAKKFTLNTYISKTYQIADVAIFRISDTVLCILVPLSKILSRTCVFKSAF